MIRENVGGASHADRSLGMGGKVKSYLAFLFMAFFAMILPNWASAAAPPAGAVIGNQAVASYTDAGGNNRTTTSNLVSTNILQVAGVDIEANLTRNTAPGSTVYLPHTITNTGNGNDTYDLILAQVAGGNFNFTNLVIYADANGDGVPDNFTPLTVTPNMAPGQVFNIVIAAQVPDNATNGQQSQVTVTTTSKFDNTVTDSNTDTVKITTNANVPVTKALSVQSGPAGTMVTVTLTYTNNGANPATNLVLTDTLDARYTYQAGTGLWSATLPTALTDAADGNEGGINYTASGQVVTATIASVAAGQSGFVKFTVKVVDGTLPGVIPNKADVSYGDGGGNTVVTNTNTSNFKVDPVVSVRLSDINSTNDTDGTQNDIVTRPAIPQGGFVIFDNVVKNTGNGVDTFNVTFDDVNDNYPAGTSFQLLRADDTPMVDSTGDGIPDTGPLAPGAEFHVHLKVQLPINATGSGPFDIVKKATSSADPTKSDTTTDRLLGITGNTVDLTNNMAFQSSGAAAPGQGVTTNGEVSAVTTNTVNPGQSTDFTLFVNNTSSAPDSYNLVGSTDNTFGTISLPAGWSLVFRNAATNAVIANTGTIAAGANLRVIATVTVPAGQSPGTTNIFFRAQSPTSGATDVKRDAVTVNPIIDLSITPNNVGQGFPGGQVVYKHTLSNNGNTAVADAPITFTNSTTAWNSVIWYDKNGNGVIDAADVQIDNVNDITGGLPAGAQVPLLVQVFVPSGATDGAANTTTITVKAVGDTNAANDSATDTTTVQPGNVSITKRQALDAACDGTADGAFVATQLSAKPDQCLIYQITLTNLGTQSISSAVISDATPSFTTYVAGRGSVTPSGTLTEPAGGTAGTVKANVGGSIASGSNATLTFSVRIDK